jgi:hypothetical protein
VKLAFPTTDCFKINIGKVLEKRRKNERKMKV